MNHPEPVRPYEIYAIKYAHHPRRAAENFLGGDPHDGPMPIDYFVWVVKGADKAWVVDTGFDAEVGRRRKRDVLRCPTAEMPALGIDPDAIDDVIVTHMHYDHCGNHHLFPRARFHLQDSEMRYATGRCMCHPALRLAFDADDAVTMVRRVCDGRVAFHDGDDALAPGLSVHHVGGHTAGLQCCACGRRAAGSCSRPMRAISTRTTNRAGRIRSSTTSATCSKASAGCRRSRTRRRT